MTGYNDTKNKYKELANKELASYLTADDKVILLDGVKGRTSAMLRDTGATLIIPELDAHVYDIHCKERAWANPVFEDIVDTLERHSDATVVYFDGMGTIQRLQKTRLRNALARMTNLRIYWHTFNTRCNIQRKRGLRYQNKAYYALQLLFDIVPKRMKLISPIKKWGQKSKKICLVPYKRSMCLAKFMLDPNTTGRRA